MTETPDRTETVFAAAVALATAAERAALLERECADDPGLRSRVEALLRAHERAEHLLDRPAVDSPAQTVAYIASEQPGAVIAGRYKLLEMIGEGGMGTVWVAEQSEPVRRRVALKLIKAGMDSNSVLARFEAERQALAVMDHPNIAKVLDGGLTDAGRPFFVMEYVKGVPITEYCDATRMSVAERLNLFVQVCQAVQHAHQKGIIHRDLKPSNILVAPYDDKPVPKVIDFGLAKAIHQSLTERTLHTAHDMVLGTPLYMSPEQAQLNNLDVDTRSDIYSLGVLLYELLTGTTPLEKQRFKEAAWDEIKRIIREEEPPRPSMRLSSSNTLASLAAGRQIEPARLTKLVRGELDWIVMKSLEKDRARRYETANGFAADVQRYLAGEPVLAAPPSTAYRVKKFVRRHKGEVIAASLVLIALLSGLAGTTLGLWEAKRQEGIARTEAAAKEIARQAEAKQRGIAEANERKARAAANAEKAAKEREANQRAMAEKARDRTRDVLDAMVSEVTGDSLATQKEISAEQKKFLESVLGYYREFAGAIAEDERSRLRHSEAAFRVGVIEYRLGRKEQSVTALRLARDGYSMLAAEFHAVPDYRSDLATCHTNLGLLLDNLGRHAAAEEQYRQGLAIRENLAADFPAVPGYRQNLAVSHTNLGLLLNALGRRAAAEEQYRQGLAIREKLAAEFAAVHEYRQDLAMSHTNLGNLFAGLGRGPEAEDQYRTSLAINEKLAADFPTVPDYRGDLARSHNNLGLLLNDLGRREAAEEQYRLGLAIREKLAAEFPAVPDYRRDLARSHNSLGVLLDDLGRGEVAEEQHRKALAIREKLAAEFAAVPEYRQDLATTHTNLGLQLKALGRHAAEEEQYRQGLAIQEKLAAEFATVPVYRQNLAVSHGNLGSVLYGLGQHAAAEEQNRKALAIREKLAADFPAVPSYQVGLGGSYYNFGSLVRAGGDPAESLKWFGQAIDRLQPVHEKEPRDVTARQFLRHSHWGRARAYDQLRKYAEAVKDWDRAIELSLPVEQAGLRAGRASTRLQAGQVGEAVAEVADLTKSSNWNADQWYDFACVYAVASGKLADKKKEYADRAMEWLHKAVQAGYKDAAHMKKDADLDFLRDREDFQNLLASLEAKPGK